ncbi:MAG TPA: hypothetical protein VOA41_03120 [Candidatus Dormibacteraeota bacterium]|nr:hypothetical protein [Candidatus Dormibacteraeota bacterium]
MPTFAQSSSERPVHSDSRVSSFPFLAFVLALLAGQAMFAASPAAKNEIGHRAEQGHPHGPYLPIRLLDLWTFGDSITKWIEPGTKNFAQINWRNANISRYDFHSNDRPARFAENVESSRAALKEKADQAHRLGLLAYLNEYELDFPDFIARQSLQAAAARQKFMEDKLHEIFVQCPWLDGYMITPTESKLGAANPEELKAVALGAYAGMKRAEKELGQKRYLFIRSWLSAASSLAKVRSYFPITTDAEIAKDIIIVSKDGLGDFVMRRPLNPLFGTVQPHSIIAEFDVSVSEYRSLGWYPEGPAKLWGYRMEQLATTPGVVGINVHTGRLNEVSGMTPEQLFPRFKQDLVIYPFAGGVKWSPWHHLNVVTIFELLHDPWKPPQQIYEEWAAQNYGKKATRPLADLLILSDEALYHGMLTFGVNLNNHSSFIFNKKNPIEGMRSAIKYQLQLQPNLTSLFESTLDTTDRALAEKRESIDLVNTMIQILDGHEADFVPADYMSIRKDMLRMKSAMKGYEFAQAGYFAYEMVVAEPPLVNRSYYLKILKKMVEDAEELAVSEPDFLHQKTDGSFVHFTRAVRDSLKSMGLW